MSQKTQINSKTTNALWKVTLVLAKIAEILHWCLVVAMLIGGLVAIFQASAVERWLQTSPTLGNDTVLSCYGFESIILNSNHTLNFAGLLVFALGSAVILSLMAMIFRNVYLILKTAQGKTWFAKGDTPFQQNIVRMFREIGIFFLIISVASLISTTVVSSLGAEVASGFNYLSGFVGLVFLCISQFFSYGTSLEKDLDGLV